MSELSTISLDLIDQLEESLLKQASLESEIASLQSENRILKDKLESASSKEELQKKASDSFDLSMLSATTALEKAGFFSQGSAVSAYKTLSENPKEIPVLLEKLASALSTNFSDGEYFQERLNPMKKSASADPWLALLENKTF